MLRVAALAAIAALMAPIAIAGISESPDPIVVDVSSAFVRGKSVIVPVSNISYEPITAVVTALYDDLTEVHQTQVVVPLAAKQTVLVTGVFTITDDISPQVSITEGPDPIPQGIVLGTALWSD